MGVERSIKYLLVFLGFILIFAAPISLATLAADVSAINNLCAALGTPPLTRWTPTAGDPCDEKWQGVVCDDTNTKIISITVNGANLGGELGDTLGSFSSLQSIDLSNNLIGGSMPTNLPVTLTNISLADNNFTRTIPDALSSFLTSTIICLSLNNNHLSGKIPDSFEGLTGLVNLDLSGNSLIGELPSSLQSLSSLTIFHLQNNNLSGTIDVLQDLPLLDLNIENNLFIGPIPDKLLAIPNFKTDGNLFNTTTTTTSAAPPAPPNTTTSMGSGTPFFPSPKQTPSKQPPGKQVPPQVGGPSSTPDSNSTNKAWSAKKIVLVSLASVFGFIVLALVCMLCLLRRVGTNRIPGMRSKRHEIAPYTGYRENNVDIGPFYQPTYHVDKVPKVAAVVQPKEQHQPLSPPLAPPRRPPAPSIKSQTVNKMNVERLTAIPKQDSMEIDMSQFDIDSWRPPPPPPPLTSQPINLPFEKVIVEPIIPVVAAPKISVRSYSIALLQQYTNSFSQDNFIGRGMLGSVYRAQLPNGKLLAVKKLDKKVISQQKEEDFIELLNNLDRIRHANVVELMGYCSEHGQRLLIYEYCTSGTLQDALHSDEDYKKKYSWNARVRMALGAARALEYMHDFCKPPVIHRNFKSANVLLDEDDLSVRVSDCGLAPLISRGSVNQLSGNLLSTFGYGAPEFESGIYTSMSDVYSFGVVMLELLTGRTSYDSTRHRGEQLLVRWAVPQLYDIDALLRVVDPSLNREYPIKSLSNFADIISRCVQAEPEFRPPMSEVVQDLIQMIRREASNRSDGD